VQVLPVSLEVDDRVADELTRPMKGDITATLDLEQFNAACSKLSLGRDEMAGFRSTTQRNDRGMLDQQQDVVGYLPRNASGRRRALEFQRFSVRDGTEVDDGEVHG
jgi:hypothetical protein